MASHIPTAWKKLLLDQTPNLYKLALFDSAVPAVDTITVYSTTNESVGTGYTAGGQAITNSQSISGTVALQDFVDASWTGSFTTRWGMIYIDTTIGAIVKPVVAILDWGASKSVAGGTFTVDFPASGAATSTIQLA